MTILARFTINQATLPAGTVDIARTDGVISQLVTLTADDYGASTYTFKFLDTPPGSSAVLVQNISDQKIWTFTPDLTGTYLIALIVDEGLSTENTRIRVFGVRNASGHRIPALNELADPSASLLNSGQDVIDASYDNANDYSNADYNNRRYAGWWRSFAEIANSLSLNVSSVKGSNGITPITPQVGTVTLSGANLLPIDGSRNMTGVFYAWQQSSIPVLNLGGLYYDTSYDCLVTRDTNNFYKRIGQDIDTIAFNEDTTSFSVGQVANISNGAGSITGNIKVKKADNTVASLSNMILGICQPTVGVGVGLSGKFIRYGKCYGCNTSAWSVGDILYVSTNGNLTNVQPTSGAIIPVGVVDFVGTSNGVIFVDIGSESVLSGDVNGNFGNNQVDSLANGGVTVSQSPLGATSWGFWPSTVTPSTSNYCLYINSSEAKLNASTTVRLLIGNVAAVTATSSGVSLASAGSTATRFEANSINTSYVPMNFPESTIPSTPSDGSTIFSTEDLTVKSSEGFVKTICPAGESGSQEVSIVKSIDGYGSHTTSFDIEGELFALNFSGTDFATVKVKCELYGGADGTDQYYQERIALLSRVSGSWVLSSESDLQYIEGSGSSFEPMDFSLSGTDNRTFNVTFFGDTAGLYQIIIKINGRE